MRKNLRIDSVLWSETLRREPELAHTVHSDLYAWANQGELQSLVSRSYPMYDAPTALQAVQEGKHPGKVVLVP